MSRWIALALLLSPTAVIAAGDGHDAGHAVQLLYFAYANFAILVVLLAWKLRAPLRRAAKDRYDAITHELHRVAHQRAELQAELKTATDRLANAEGEAARLLADIESVSKKQADQILAAATAQAEMARRSAEQQIGALESEAQAELVATAVTLLKTSTSEQLRQTVDAGVSTSYSKSGVDRIGAAG